MMPAGTLESIPSAFRRSIARQTQTMNPDGTFTARLVVDPRPKRLVTGGVCMCMRVPVR